MSKYLSIESIKKDLAFLRENGCTSLDLREIEERMEYTVPAAEVAPVVHASWKECQKSMWYCCTNCGCETANDRSTGTELLSDFCPNCGARMDGDV